KEEVNSLVGQQYQGKAPVKTFGDRNFAFILYLTIFGVLEVPLIAETLIEGSILSDNKTAWIAGIGYFAIIAWLSKIFGEAVSEKRWGRMFFAFTLFLLCLIFVLVVRNEAEAEKIWALTLLSIILGGSCLLISVRLYQNQPYFKHVLA